MFCLDFISSVKNLFSALYDAIWDFRFSITIFSSFSQESVFDLLNFSYCSCNWRDVISCLKSKISFIRNDLNIIIFALMWSNSFWLHKFKDVRFFFLSQEIENFITGVSWVPIKVELTSGLALVVGLSVLLWLSRSNLAFATGTSWAPIKEEVSSKSIFVLPLVHLS